MTFRKKMFGVSFFLLFSFHTHLAFSCLPHSFLKLTQTEAPFHTLYLKENAHARYQASISLNHKTIVTFYNCNKTETPHSDSFVDIVCTKGNDTLQVFGVFGEFSATWSSNDGNTTDFVVKP